MTVVVTSREDLTLEAYERVTRRNEDVRLAPEAIERIQAARQAFEALIDAEPPPAIYGVTTGYGDRASIRLDREARKQQAARGATWLRIAFGEPLPERVTRGIVLARLASMIEGHGAVRPVVAEAVAAMLGGELPPVPARGHGGAGEIVPLGHLFAGLAELGLVEKESIALINGSPGASSLAADAALSAPRRLALAEAVLALSAEAVAAPLEAYAPELDDLWEDEHEAAALARQRSLLEGGALERRAYQAPVSYRIVPRVTGQARRAASEAERAASVALRSVTDNPVFVPATGAVLSNGSYHNAQAPAALDGLAAAWADLARLAERQVQVLVHEPTALGMHEWRGWPPAHMVAVGLAEEASSHATRTPLPPGGPGQNDVASPSFLAWGKQEAAAECFGSCLALLAAVASLALERAGRPGPPALGEFLAGVREHVPPSAFEAGAGDGIGELARTFAGLAFQPQHGGQVPLVA